MKNLIFTLFLSFFTLVLTAQDQQTDLAVGTTFVLGKTSLNGYSHIKLPKKNILIKKGVISKYNTLDGQKVIVKEIITTKKGKYAKLELLNGNKFFNNWSYIKADLDKAIQAGELVNQKHLSKKLVAYN